VFSNNPFLAKNMREIPEIIKKNAKSFNDFLMDKN